MKNEICPVGTERFLNRLGYAMDVRRTHWSATDGMDSVPASLQGGEKIADGVVSALLPDRDLNCGRWPEKKSAVPAEVMLLREGLELIDAKIVRGPLLGDGLDEVAERNGLILAYNILSKFLAEVPRETIRLTPDQLRFRRHQAIQIRRFGNKFFERRVR